MPAARLFGQFFHLLIPESKGKKNFELDPPLQQGLFISLQFMFIKENC